jgi:hypothetical protein
MLKICEECRSLFDVNECESGEFVLVEVNTGSTYIKFVEDICPVCETGEHSSELVNTYEIQRP